MRGRLPRGSFRGIPVGPRCLVILRDELEEGAGVLPRRRDRGSARQPRPRRDARGRHVQQGPRRPHQRSRAGARRRLRRSGLHQERAGSARGLEGFVPGARVPVRPLPGAHQDQHARLGAAREVLAHPLRCVRRGPLRRAGHHPIRHHHRGHAQGEQRARQGELRRPRGVPRPGEQIHQRPAQRPVAGRGGGWKETLRQL